MRTILDLPDETFLQLKAQAALNGVRLKELLTQLMQRRIQAGSRSSEMTDRSFLPHAPSNSF
jgi:hypothetical protein